MKIKWCFYLLKPIAWSLNFIGDLLIAAEESRRLHVPFRKHFASYRNTSMYKWNKAWGKS